MCGMVFNGPPHVFLVGKLMDFHGYKVSNVKDETLHNLKGIYIYAYIKIYLRICTYILYVNSVYILTFSIYIHQFDDTAKLF